MLNIKQPRVPFKPKGLFKNGHVQTIYAALFHTRPFLKPTKKLYIPVDKETMLACEYNQAYNSPNHQVVILVHGLGSCAHANYINSTARKLLSKGFDVIRINIRGSGPTLHLTPTLYHAGLTIDVKTTLEYTIESLQYKDVILAGFSMGANIVLKLAGEYGESTPSELKGICAVSPPLNMPECSDAIKKLQNRVYDDYYLKHIKIAFRKKTRYFPEEYNLDMLERIKILYHFDDYLVAPQFGYKDADDYHRQNSSYDYLSAINVKTLLIQSDNDPIIPFKSTKSAMQELVNPNLEYMIGHSGGHVGFINNKQLARQDVDSHWAENRIIDFVEEQWSKSA